nr:hypothetical protein [Candidatus Njordarchaeum guaymaensis]
MVKGVILSIFDMTYGYMPVHMLPKSLEEDLGKEALKTITRESVGLGGVETKSFRVDENLCVSKSFTAPMPEVRGGETLYSLTVVGIEEEAEREWIAKVSDGALSLREIIIMNGDASKPDIREMIELWMTESSCDLSPQLKSLTSLAPSILAGSVQKLGMENLSVLFHLLLTRQPFLIDSSIELDLGLLAILSPNRKVIFAQNPSKEGIDTISNILSKERENPEIPRTVIVCKYDDKADSSLKSIERGWVIVGPSVSSFVEDQKKEAVPFFDGAWHNTDKKNLYELEQTILDNVMKEKENKQVATVANEILKLNTWARKCINTLWEWEMSRDDLKEQLSIDDKLLDLVEEICKGEYYVDPSQLYGKKRRR